MTPGAVGQRLDELVFGGAFGVVFGGESLDVLLIGIEVVGGKDDDLAGESVPECVQGRSLFAGFGFGAGGMLCVCFVDS